MLHASVRPRDFVRLAGFLITLAAGWFLASVGVAEDLRDFQKAETQTQAVLPKILAATVGIHLEDSTGSGVIVQEDGLLVSAAHVLMAPGTEFDVELQDGRKLKAKALGMDHDADVAVARITTAGKYPFTPLAKSKSLKVADWCLATGHPEGIFAKRKPPVRLGRVLEINDFRTPGEGVVSDAPVFPGDSGGPLCNLAGEVVGIHSSIGVYLTENIHAPVEALHERWADLVAGKEFGEPVELEESFEMLAWSAAPDSLVGLIDSVASWFIEPPEWPDLAKDGPATLQALEPATLELRRSIVDVHCDGQPAAIGLLVGDGLVLTKASQLTGEIVCGIGGRERSAEIVARDRPRDLALVKLKGKVPKNLKAVKLASGDAPPTGSWLVTPDVDGSAYSLGIVSNGVTKAKRPKRPHGALRIEIEDGPNGEAKIGRVVLGGPAQRAGLRVGDLVLAVDEQPVASADLLYATIEKTRPGQEIWVTVQRGKERLRYSAILAEAAGEDDDYHGEVSRRRGGFPLTYAHDSAIEPTACGGPLVDLRGQIVGVNIARAGRFTTLALPLSEVRKSLDTMLAKVKAADEAAAAK